MEQHKVNLFYSLAFFMTKEESDLCAFDMEFQGKMRQYIEYISKDYPYSVQKIPIQNVSDARKELHYFGESNFFQNRTNYFQDKIKNIDRFLSTENTYFLPTPVITINPEHLPSFRLVAEKMNLRNYLKDMEGNIYYHLSFQHSDKLGYIQKVQEKGSSDVETPDKEYLFAENPESLWELAKEYSGSIKKPKFQFIDAMISITEKVRTNIDSFALDCTNAGFNQFRHGNGFTGTSHLGGPPEVERYREICEKLLSTLREWRKERCVDELEKQAQSHKSTKNQFFQIKNKQEFIEIAKELKNRGHIKSRREFIAAVRGEGICSWCSDDIYLYYIIHKMQKGRHPIILKEKQWAQILADYFRFYKKRRKTGELITDEDMIQKTKLQIQKAWSNNSQKYSAESL